MTCLALLVIAAAALTLAVALLGTKNRRQKSHALYACAAQVGALAILDVLRGYWGLFGLSVATMLALLLWADDEHERGKQQ